MVGMETNHNNNHQSPPALPPKQRVKKTLPVAPPSPVLSPTEGAVESVKSPVKLPDLLEHTAAVPKEEFKGGDVVSPSDMDLIEESDVDRWLVKKKQEEEDPEIRGGPIDALIIQATKATKNGGKFLSCSYFFCFVSMLFFFILIWYSFFFYFLLLPSRLALQKKRRTVRKCHEEII